MNIHVYTLKLYIYTVLNYDICTDTQENHLNCNRSFDTVLDVITDTTYNPKYMMFTVYIS